MFLLILFKDFVFGFIIKIYYNTISVYIMSDNFLSVYIFKEVYFFGFSPKIDKFIYSRIFLYPSWQIVNLFQK